jgi:hypothetical protein
MPAGLQFAGREWHYTPCNRSLKKVEAQHLRLAAPRHARAGVLKRSILLVSVPDQAVDGLVAAAYSKYLASTAGPIAAPGR